LTLTEAPTARQGTALVFIVLVLLVTVGVAVQGLAVYPGLLFTEVVLLLGLTLAACRRLGLDPRAVLRLQRPSPGSGLFPIGLGIGIGGLAFGMAIGLTYPVFLLLILVGGRHPGLPLPLSEPADLLWAAATGVVVAPLCEEMLFRGFFLSSLKRYGLHVMVWTAAVCFGIFHADLVRFIPTMALGVVFGYLTAHAGSIYPAVAAHGTNNFLALSLGYLAGAGGGERPALTYEAIEQEMIQKMTESDLPLGGLEPEQAVLAAILATMVLFAAGGLALAGVLALILRALGRRAGARRLPEEAMGECPGEAMPVLLGEPAEAPMGEPPAVPLGLRDLLRIPWCQGIGAIGLLFWGLSLWSYFSPGNGG
jgi:membrane protease YdiL (CAAX protease family)